MSTTNGISKLNPRDELPKGLRHLGEDRWLIQLAKDGKRLTKRVRGSRAEALRVLQDAPVELGKLLGGAGSPSRRGSSGHGGGGRSTADVPTLGAFLSVGGRFENHQLRHQSERTRRKLDSPIRYLLASPLATRRLDDITARDINDYVEWRMKVGQLSFSTTKAGAPRKARATEVSAPTINKSLGVLSAALNFARREGLVESVPHIEKLSEANARRVHGPSKEELVALLEAAEKLRPDAPWLPEVIELVVQFGFRPGELFSLTWESVDFEHKGNGKNKGCVYVEETQHVGNVVKERKRRLIPMTPRGREVLERLKQVATAATDFVVPNRFGLPYIRLDVPGMKGGGAGIWKKLRALTHVNVTLYSLRHAFAEQTLTAGVPLHIASRWMGHSKLELTSKRYGDFAPDNASQWDWAGAREG